MGWFRSGGTEGIELNNACLDCEPQNDGVSKASVAKIDDALREGENVHFLTKIQEIFTEGRGQGLTGSGVVAATDERVVGKRFSILGNEVTTVKVPYHNITSVDVRCGRFVTSLNIKTEGKRYRFFDLGTSDSVSNEMGEFIRDQEVESNQQKQQTEGNRDPIDDLERLRDLKNEGIISSDEFENKKKNCWTKYNVLFCLLSTRRRV